MTVLKRGFVHIYTGHGKGKTTAALGLALRAAGRGLRTYIGQFMKGRFYGELAALRDHPLITIEQFGRPECIHREEVTPEDVERAAHALARARAVLTGGQYAVVILDEINVALWFGLLTLDDILALLDERPEQVELILTGRYAPPALIERADLVTEMREVKHYYQQGIPARKGIEY
jgi:cob(I)alamin adenosyltransferase